MEEEIKSIVKVSKYIFKRELVSGKAGNVSARFKSEDGSDIVAISPTLKSLNDLNEEDIVLLDLDGNIISGGKPSSEFNMHLEIYKQRNDIKGIVHTHSPYATGFSFSEKRIKRLEGFGKIKTPFFEEIEYEKPGSIELAKKAGNALGKIKEEDVLVLKQHGILTTADNVEEAGALAEFVESIAKTQFISFMLNQWDWKVFKIPKNF